MICKSKDIDYNRDLSIKITDYFWYEYMGMSDEIEEYNFNLQDTINEIINEHFGVKEEELVDTAQLDMYDKFPQSDPRNN